MRHRVYGKHLGRNKDERDNLFRGLVQALLTHGTIQTSETKAKAIKPLVDKIINSAKNPHNQSQLLSFVNRKDLRERLTKEILPKLGSKTSGYTRVIRIGTRLGDQTTQVKISLIGAEELKPIIKEQKAKKETKESEVLVKKSQSVETKTADKEDKVKTATKKLKKLTSRSKK